MSDTAPKPRRSWWARGHALPLFIAAACGGPQDHAGSGKTCFRDDDCLPGLICVAPEGERMRVCSNDPTPLISNVEGPPAVDTGGSGAVAGATAGGGMMTMGGSMPTAGSAAGGSDPGGGTDTGGSDTGGADTGGTDTGGTDTGGTGGTGGGAGGTSGSGGDTGGTDPTGGTLP
ncbi:MAG TPA: hypothetical protein VIW29_16940 [Polyangiaceae bacterium]